MFDNTILKILMDRYGHIEDIENLVRFAHNWNVGMLE